MEACWKCGAPLSADEVGLNYKIVNRAVTKFQCLTCLSRAFNMTTDNLKVLIERFRAAGCSMFPPKPAKDTP